MSQLRETFCVKMYLTYTKIKERTEERNKKFNTLQKKDAFIAFIKHQNLLITGEWVYTNTETT